MNYKEGYITRFNTHIHYVNGIPMDCCPKSYKYILELEKENKSLKDKLKATRKGLNKVLSKRKKWKDRYYKERRKNKQLEQALNEIKEYIKSWTVYECDKNTVRELSFESSKEDVLQIIDKYKWSDS